MFEVTNEGQRNRPATISGIEDVFNDVNDAQQNGHVAHDASPQGKSIRRAISSPATLNRQCTFDELKMEAIQETPLKDSAVVTKKQSSK